MTQYPNAMRSWPYEYPRAARLAHAVLFAGLLLTIVKTGGHFGILPPVGGKEFTVETAVLLLGIFVFTWLVISFSAYRGVSVDNPGTPRSYVFGIYVSAFGAILMLVRIGFGFVFS